MKQVYVLIIIVVLTAMLCACTDDNNNKPADCYGLQCVLVSAMDTNDDQQVSLLEYLRGDDK